MGNIQKEVIYTNDDLPTLSFTINKEDGTGPFSLVGVHATTGITCVLRLLGSPTPTSTGYCSVTGGAAGTCSFSLPAALADEGIYTGQLVVTLAGGYQRTSKFQLDVREGMKGT